MSVVNQFRGRTLFRFKRILFGARGGVIHMYDERDGAWIQKNPADMLDLAKAIGREAEVCSCPHEKKQLRDGANEIMQCLREVHEQGSVYDDKAMAWKSRHNQHRTKRVFQVGSQMPMGGAVMLPGIGGTG